MDGGIDPHEAALRRLPEAHSLALRLRSAGAANDVICDYLRIAPEGLDALMQVAAAKLAAELKQGEPVKDSARSALIARAAARSPYEVPTFATDRRIAHVAAAARRICSRVKGGSIIQRWWLGR